METMEVNVYIAALAQYGIDKKLIEPCDKAFIINPKNQSLATLFEAFAKKSCNRSLRTRAWLPYSDGSYRSP